MQGIPRPVWIVVPLMFIAATPVGANSKTLVFELSPLYDKTLFKASYKHFTKNDLPQPLFPRRDILARF